MLTVIKGLLLLLFYDIDSGNSNLTEELLLKTIDFLRELLSDELSMLLSADYLGVSKSTFNNYISKGLVPEGIKKPGVTNKFWKTSDLDKIKKK